MHDFTANWGWPQWSIVFWLFLSFVSQASKHGEERLVQHGDRKGLPERYSGFEILGRTAMLLFILIAGGFFA